LALTVVSGDVGIGAHAVARLKIVFRLTEMILCVHGLVARAPALRTHPDLNVRSWTHCGHHVDPNRTDLAPEPTVGTVKQPAGCTKPGLRA
jgi:hypothetical protein